MKNETKWDLRFLNLAKEVSSWSKDPSTKVGAVIVNHERHVKGLGYNGFPSGMPDFPEMLLDRQQKYKYIIHAERNAMKFCEVPMHGLTIYTYPFIPCSICAAEIVEKKIARVVSFKSSVERWAEDFEKSRELFYREAVELLEYDIY